ncbi:GNAT family protein [Spirillospora sp. NPDC047279]|uniref:GNAT family N-acetyltransferase n=1 Tax=Spirillospora sp. NPDC047279 TaxID=3155478 RepID=UPI0033DB4672
MFTHALGEGAELRPLEPWQAEEFAAHVLKVADQISPYIPWAKKIVDVDGARELLQLYADKQAVDARRMYGIWLDGVLVGGTVFRTFDAELGVCEIGVWLAADARGRGLVTTAARHMIDWAVNVRGIERVEWWCVPENEPSRAAAKRIGFTYEGTLRSAAVLEGRRYDLEVWSLLKDEL